MKKTTFLKVGLLVCSMLAGLILGLKLSDTTEPIQENDIIRTNNVEELSQGLFGDLGLNSMEYLYDLTIHQA